MHYWLPNIFFFFSENNILNILFDNDPAQFTLLSNLTYEMTSTILKLGSSQPRSNELPGGKYPQKNGHRFLESLYHIIWVCL